MNRHDDKTARQLYESALKQLDGSQDNAAKLETMIKLGDCDSRLGDRAAAATLYEQSLPLAQSICGGDTKETGYVLIRVGQSEVEQNKLDDADHHLSSALKMDNQYETSARVSLMRALADLYSKQKKTVEADALRREAKQAEMGPRPVARPVGRWAVSYVSPPGELVPAPPPLAVPASPGQSAHNTLPVDKASADVDFGPYMADLQRRIKKHWSPPAGAERSTVVVTFKITESGELSDLHINRSSGALPAERAALKAVEDSATFSPLPAGAPKVVAIEFTFDFNFFVGRNGTAALRQF